MARINPYVVLKALKLAISAKPAVLQFQEYAFIEKVMKLVHIKQNSFLATLKSLWATNVSLCHQQRGQEQNCC